MIHNTAIAGSIVCDLEKAFDDLLLSKLPNYGISGIFRIDIKEFKSIIHILILTQSQIDKNKIWGATGFEFGPIVISSIHH
jgi:hypothetical protein